MKLLTIIAVSLGAFASTGQADVLQPPGGPVYVGDQGPTAHEDYRPRGRFRDRTRAMPDSDRMMKKRQLRRALVEQFDANGDGRLGPRERMRAVRVLRRIEQKLGADGQRGPRRQRMIQRFDTNRDGRVGPREMPPGAAERMRRFDRDRDGWVEPGEL